MSDDSAFPGQAPDAFPGGPNPGELVIEPTGPPLIMLPTSVILTHTRQSSVIMKQGDTTPALTATLQDGFKRPIDLTDAEVTLYIRGGPRRALIVAAVCTIVLAVAGTVLYDWLDEDLAATGTYHIEFVIVYPDGKQITCPSDNYLVLTVVAQLA